MAAPPAPSPEPEPAEAEEGVKLFPEEGPSGGCASGECLPDAEGAGSAAEARPAPASPAPAAPGSRELSPRDHERWRVAVERVKQASSRHGASLAFGRLLRLAPGEVAVGYIPAEGFHRSTVTGGGKATIEKALSDFFGQSTRLVVESAPDLPAGAPVSIAEEDARSRAAHEKSTDAKVRAHPSVRATLRILGGEIEHVQVMERERPAVAPVESEATDDSA